MRLYSGPMSMFGAKAQIAVREKGLDAEVVMVPFGVRRRYDPKHPEVERVNPKRQVPVLVDGAVEIYDSTQIFEYLEHQHPDPALWPADPAARAQARRLEHESDEVFFPHVIRLMSSASDGHAEALAGAASFHAAMDGRLRDGTYLAGPYSYADIAFFMACFFGEFLGAQVSQENSRLLEWRARVADRPAVRSVVEPMADYMRRKGVVDDGFRRRILAGSGRDADANGRADARSEEEKRA